MPYYSVLTVETGYAEVAARPPRSPSPAAGQTTTPSVFSVRADAPTPMGRGQPQTTQLTTEAPSSELVARDLDLVRLPPSSPPSDSSSPPSSPTVEAVRRARKGKGRARPRPLASQSVSQLPALGTPALRPDLPPGVGRAPDSRKRRRIDAGSLPDDDDTGLSLRSQQNASEGQPVRNGIASDSDVEMAERVSPPTVPLVTPSCSVDQDPEVNAQAGTATHQPQMRSASYVTRPGIASPPPRVPVLERLTSPSVLSAGSPSDIARQTPPPPYSFSHRPNPGAMMSDRPSRTPPPSQHNLQEPRRRPHQGPPFQSMPPPGLPLGTPIPLQVTRVPAGGWRRIQGDDHYWRVRGMDPHQLEAWLGDQGPAVLVQVPSIGASDPGVFDRLAAIRDLLRTFFELDNVTVTAAIPPDGAHRANSEPFFNIIRGPGLSWADVEELVEIQWLSTPSLMLNFKPFAFEAPTFLGAWRHIERFGDASELGIRRAFQRGMQSEVMRIGITRLLAGDIENEGLWAGYTVQEAYRSLLRSIEVRIISNRRAGENAEPLALLYCLSPTAFPPEWLLFRDHVQMFPYGTAANGSPEFVTHHLWCTICHSTDHPTHQCYLPSVHGWFGPQLPVPRRTRDLSLAHSEDVEVPALGTVVGLTADRTEAQEALALLAKTVHDSRPLNVTCLLLRSLRFVYKSHSFSCHGTTRRRHLLRQNVT